MDKRLSQWTRDVVEPEHDTLGAVRYAQVQGAGYGEKETASSKRELIDTKRGGTRYVRRGGGGKFKEGDQVSRALARDRRKRAKKKAKRGHGDRGDR